MSRLVLLLCLTISICVSVSVSVSVSACPDYSRSYQPTADTIHIDNIVDMHAPRQNEISVERIIPIGRDVVIELPSNPSTGYGWNWMNGELTLVTDPNGYRRWEWRGGEPTLPSLTYLGCFYNSTAPEGVVGGGGIEYWGFRASVVGPSTIPLAYRQQWKGGAESTHVTIQLHVKSNGTVSDDINANGRAKFYNNGYTLQTSVTLILSLLFLSCCL